MRCAHLLFAGLLLRRRRRRRWISLVLGVLARAPLRRRQMRRAVFLISWFRIINEKIPHSGDEVKRTQLEYNHTKAA